MAEVTLLLFTGIALIVLNVNAIKKEKKSFSGTLKDKENNMQDYEIEIGKLRRDLSETVLELQQEIEALKLTRENNNLKYESVDHSLTKTFVKEIEVTQNNKSNEKRKNEIKDQSEDTKEPTSENSVVKQNKDEVKKTNNTINSYDIVDENNKSDGISKSNKDNKSSGNNVKVTEIKTMLDQGLSVDEISEKIGIGKGEVLLIKELYLK